MLKKLMKYDLSWIMRVIVYYAVAVFIIAALTRFTNTMADRSMFWLIADKVMSSLSITAIVALLINTFIRIGLRFIHNFYKDESYLTHTLPVSRSTLFLSKTLSGFLVILFMLVVVAASAAIVLLNDVTRETLLGFLQDAVYRRPLLLFGLLIVLEMFFLLLCSFVSIPLGYRKSSHRMLFNILFLALIYTGLQLLMIGVLYLCSLADPNLAALFQQTQNGFQALAENNFGLRVLCIVAGEYLLTDIALFFIGRRLLQMGVNVD